jgi:rod shape-determining protein MreC
LLFKTWVLAVQAPIAAVTSGITDGVSYVWNGYIWMVGARAENERLKETVRHLSLLNDSYEQIRQENQRLRRLVALRDDAPHRSLGARVIARTPSFLSNVIYINRGAEDGISVDAPVVAGEGIVGRTVLVSRHQSQVQLITNPDASVGVMLDRSRTPGILKGTGDFLLDLDYINNTEPVAVGDLVLSSGLDGIFPKGLRVGKVVRSDKGKGVFRSIKVEPFADMVRLEEVSVLLKPTDS